MPISITRKSASAPPSKLQSSPAQTSSAGDGSTQSSKPKGTSAVESAASFGPGGKGAAGAGGAAARSSIKGQTVEPAFFTVADLAKRWVASTKFVRGEIRKGHLTATRFGRAVRVSLTDLRVYEALHRQS